MPMCRASLIGALVLVVGVSSVGAQVHQPRGAPSPSAPESTVVAQERALYEAFSRHDATAFNRALGSDFVFADENGVSSWKRAQTASMMQGCTLTKWGMDEVKTTPSGSDVMVVTYTWTGDEVCGGRRTPSPTIATSVWRKHGSRWVAVSHSEAPAAPRS